MQHSTPSHHTHIPSTPNSHHALQTALSPYLPTNTTSTSSSLPPPHPCPHSPPPASLLATISFTEQSPPHLRPTLPFTSLLHSTSLPNTHLLTTILFSAFPSTKLVIIPFPHHPYATCLPACLPVYNSSPSSCSSCYYHSLRPLPESPSHLAYLTCPNHLVITRTPPNCSRHPASPSPFYASPLSMIA